MPFFIWRTRFFHILTKKNYCVKVNSLNFTRQIELSRAIIWYIVLAVLLENHFKFYFICKFFLFFFLNLLFSSVCHFKLLSKSCLKTIIIVLFFKYNFYYRDLLERPWNIGVLCFYLSNVWWLLIMIQVWIQFRLTHPDKNYIAEKTEKNN